MSKNGIIIAANHNKALKVTKKKTKQIKVETQLIECPKCHVTFTTAHMHKDPYA